MDTLDYILQKYNLVPDNHGHTEIPNMGRDNLAELFAELGFTTGPEIGVEQGLFSEVLCKGVPGLKLYCVDAWLAYPGYRDHVSQETNPTHGYTRKRYSGLRWSETTKP